MPGPSVIVTLADAGGDEFPVRMWGTRESFADDDCLAGEALAELHRLEKEDGRWRPNYPVSVKAVEWWNQLDDVPEC